MSDTPKFKFYDIKYSGDVQEFRNLLKKQISFDYKEMGNETIYVKIKTSLDEKFLLYMKACSGKESAIKSYAEITEDVYKGALTSLDSILTGK